MATRNESSFKAQTVHREMMPDHLNPLLQKSLTQTLIGLATILTSLMMKQLWKPMTAKMLRPSWRTFCKSSAYTTLMKTCRAGLSSKCLQMINGRSSPLPSCNEQTISLGLFQVRRLVLARAPLSTFYGTGQKPFLNTSLRRRTGSPHFISCFCICCSQSSFHMSFSYNLV